MNSDFKFELTHIVYTNNAVPISFFATKLPLLHHGKQYTPQISAQHWFALLFLCDCIALYILSFDGSCDLFTHDHQGWVNIIAAIAPVPTK